MLKLILHEDDHLLVVNKPAGWNTHAPAPYAGEGVYEWLRDREPRWAALAILHRLDKETSGVMVFGKTPVANRSLTAQFASRQTRKRYVLLTARPPAPRAFEVTSTLVRAGERYFSRPGHVGGEVAVTRFQVIGKRGAGALLEAEPLTGRTHQIRVHAADRGVPILGDALYGGAPARRLCLHAARLEFAHPADGSPVSFEAPADFDADPALLLRQALLDEAETDSCRLVHGAADGWPGWYVDRLGAHLLSQSEDPLTEARQRHLESLRAAVARASSVGGETAAAGERAGEERGGVYHKTLDREVRRLGREEASPRLMLGTAAGECAQARENGLRFEIRFQEGYSVGLFLDQRDNRRRLLTGRVAAGFPLFPGGAEGRSLLNTFAYTCAFSVCGARAGLRVTSLDLSRKCLEWGRRNFVLNGIDPAGHDFIYGDVFGWLRRLANKGRRFDAVILDPPTFSQSREHGVFRADRDYGGLARAALAVLAADGILLASTNAARYAPARFLEDLSEAVRLGGRRILQRHYAPQPPDFPISRDEPAHLKTVWLRIA